MPGKYEENSNGHENICYDIVVECWGVVPAECENNRCKIDNYH